jgi:ribonuclease HIII
LSIEHEHRFAEQEQEQEKKLEHDDAPKLQLGGVWNGDFFGGHSVMVAVRPN